jgi:RNA polymerase sigma factor (sigma-70 family)
MEKVQNQDRCDTDRHPWEQVEWLFQLIYWVRPESRNWNDALEELKPILRGTAMRILRGHADARQLADDIVQEWMATLWRLFATYDPDRPFFPLAYTAFQRLCWSRIRSDRRTRLPGLTHDPIDPRCNPLRDTRPDDLRDRLGSALWRLPKEQREVIVRRWKGVDLANTARRRGCTLRALYIRGTRARKQLKIWLADLARHFRRTR